MSKRIALIQGHPSPEQTHLGHALAAAYRDAARDGGHEVREIGIAQLDFPLLRTATEWRGPIPESLRDAQATIGWADHVVVVFPLWSGTLPACTKAFFEQVARPGFAFRPRPDGRGLMGLLGGRSARIVVSMAVPAFVFRWAHGALGVRSFAGYLKFCGVSPVRTTYIGRVDAPGFPATQWLDKMRALGRSAK